jgi:hypothetical protein
VGSRIREVQSSNLGLKTGFLIYDFHDLLQFIRVNSGLVLAVKINNNNYNNNLRRDRFLSRIFQLIIHIPAFDIIAVSLFIAPLNNPQIQQIKPSELKTYNNSD